MAVSVVDRVTRAVPVRSTLTATRGPAGADLTDRPAMRDGR
ncbi:hypothetical protein ACJ6WF_05480 [Streptomyces sp. MMS24-I2-30]